MVFVVRGSEVWGFGYVVSQFKVFKVRGFAYGVSGTGFSWFRVSVTGFSRFGVSVTGFPDSGFRVGGFEVQGFG